MSEPYIFNLYLPSCSVFGNSASPTELTLNAHTEGVFLSYFSGSSISDTLGDHIRDIGALESYTDNQWIFNLYFPDSVSLNSKPDEYYEVIIYNYLT